MAERGVPAAVAIRTRSSGITLEINDSFGDKAFRTRRI